MCYTRDGVLTAEDIIPTDTNKQFDRLVVCSRIGLLVSATLFTVMTWLMY